MLSSMSAVVDVRQFNVSRIEIVERMKESSEYSSLDYVHSIVKTKNSDTVTQKIESMFGTF